MNNFSGAQWFARNCHSMPGQAANDSLAPIPLPARDHQKNLITSPEAHKLIARHSLFFPFNRERLGSPFHHRAYGMSLAGEYPKRFSHSTVKSTLLRLLLGM